MSTPDQDIVLYHYPESFYSQIVAVALRYLNLKYTEKKIDLTKLEHLEYWFLDKNYRGEVPVIEDGDVVLPDSSNILKYLNDTYDTRGSDQKLLPEPSTTLGKKVVELNELLSTVNVAILTFGSIYHPEHCVGNSMGKEEFEGRKGLLKAMAIECEKRLAVAPEKYHPTYRQKIEKLKKSSVSLSSSERLLEEIVNTRTVLEQIETTLAGGNKKWLLSDFLSSSDIRLMIMLNRIKKVGLSHHFFADGALPNVLAYFERNIREPYMKESLL